MADSKYNLFEAQGVPGLPAYNGYLFDEWMRELQGPRGRRTIREMQDNDPIVGAILFALEMLIRQVGWRIAAHPQAPAEDPRVEFIDGARQDMAVTWEDTLSEILSFLPYGFSLHELMYKRRDGVNSRFSDNFIGWHSWPMRGQETLQRWEFDPKTWEATAMIQLGPPDWQVHTIPFEKALLFRTSTKRGNPEGRSILRNAFRPWFFKKQIEQIEAIGIERDLAGIPMAEIPMEYLADDATADQVSVRNAVFEIVTNIRRNEQEGVVWPVAYDENNNRLFELKLLTTGGKRQFDTDTVIARHEQRMLMTVLADMIMLGHEKVGSNALAESKGKLFTTALGAWLASICAIVNNDAIPRLLKLNGMSTEASPQLMHGDIERPDLDLLGTFMLHLAQAGFELDTRFNSELAKRLHELAGLPVPPDDVPTELRASNLTVNEPDPDAAPEDTTDDAEESAEPPGDTE